MCRSSSPRATSPPALHRDGTIEGPSLRPRLEHAPLALDEVIEIGSRVATALHDLHRQHLVHLDIKPSNIMFRPDGTAVLVDFGLSRHDHLPDLLDEEFTLPMGTGPYMSPEQVQFVRNDPRSDLFALGVMLYHFTTGERPFGSPDSVRGLRRRLYRDPVPPRSAARRLPALAAGGDPASAWRSTRAPLPECGTACAGRSAEPDPGGADPACRAHAKERHAAPSSAGSSHWVRSRHPPHTKASEQLDRSPIILAAVDVDNAAPELLDKLRESVRRIVLTEPGARLACASVMKIARIGMDDLVDEDGRSRHVQQLVALKHWARPISKGLNLDDGRLTFHVLEAPDVAPAIVEFARRNQVDHIVMGARGASDCAATWAACHRRWWPSPIAA
jgi:serine/threonine protein kinase